MPITPYQHRCVIQSGSLAGNKQSQDVNPYDVEYELTCDNCGNMLVTSAQIIAHIYEQLLNPV